MTQDMPRVDTHIFQNLIFFGPFQVFVGERLLERRVPVRLAGRALDILVAFAERATKGL
jgi:DNA-binding winged helix-turn-helix (wHTH) protein